MSHALLYIADSVEDSSVPDLVRIQSADVEHVLLDVFGIGDARTLRERAYLRAVEGGTRAFLVHFSTITIEAQNALLKLFEEPPEGVVFHVVIRNEEMLLPTLRSRLQILTHVKSELPEETGFLLLSYKERLEEIAVRAKKKDTKWFEAVAREVEYSTTENTSEEKALLLKSLLLVRTYLGTRGASSKMLMEELALSVPTKK